MNQLTIRRHRILLGDMVIIFISAWLSFILRLAGGLHFRDFVLAAWIFSSFSLVVKLIVFHVFGIYRIHWKYIGSREVFKLLVGSVFSSAVLVMVLIMGIVIGLHPQFPRAIIGLDLIISTCMFFVYRRLAY